MSKVGLRKIVGRLQGALADAATDGELLERFVSHRDEAAFAELVARHGPKVFAVCRRALGHHHLAEDAFQSTFVVLARRAHSIRPRSAVGGFLYGVARKAALEAFAVNRRRKETLVGRVPDSPATVAPAAEADVLAMLDEEIANLSETYRAAVVLCELDGVSRAAAARQLGIAEGTLSSRLAAARRQLAARLKARGVTLSAGLFAALVSSARAAVPPALHAATGSVSAIANGVLRAMMLSKLKLAALGIVTAVAILGASTIGPTGGLGAAPLLKTRADPGVIWVYHPFAPAPGTRTGYTTRLTGYTPGGRVVEDITLPDGDDCFLGLTPDGRQIVYAGKAGKTVGDRSEKGLTVHLRDIGDGVEGTDTGLPTGLGYRCPVWSPDMKRVVYATTAEAGDGVTYVYKYAIMDLATKKVTPLDLSSGYDVARWSSDGSWLLVAPASIGGVGWSQYTLADGKLRTLVEKRSYFYMDLSPDGKTLIGFGPGRDGVVGGPRVPWEIDRFDVATGKMTRADKFAHTPQDSTAMSRWSPDGKRVAHSVRERAPDRLGGGESYRLVVCDPDGGNEVKLAAADGQFMGWIYWLPTRSKVAGPLPK
jgi:RNA polymerase sigma factor (sigma-70 family)